jgi:Amt family ammonium transporter
MPALAFAQDAPVDPAAVQADVSSLWVVVSAILVILMQVGFLFLEIGFARGKNVGTIVAKILVNFSIAAVVWWAVGFGIAFGGGATHSIFGDSGFFLSQGQTISDTSLVPGEVGGPTYTFFLFQFAFAAVSLAIVWGSTLERIKFIAYPIYAVVFSAIIYPVVAHMLFAGNLTPFGYGIQDFAGSSVVHLCGAVAALAAVLVLGPRRGKFGPDGKPRPIPGHNMPLFGLAVLILWVGWFGFNAGSTLSATGAAFGQVAVVTNLAAATGVLGATLTVLWRLKTLDVGMIGNGAIAGLVAVTAPSGYVSPLGGVIIGFVAGVIVVFSVILIEKKIDDPVGVLSAHGVAGIWGTLACGLFTTKDLALDNQKPGLFYGGGLTQLGVQAVGVVAVIIFVFILSYAVFKLIDVTIGLRVSAEEEEAGLDISEHGMYGYPEQFIPEAELTGYNLSPVLTSASAVAATKQEV